MLNIKDGIPASEYDIYDNGQPTNGVWALHAGLTPANGLRFQFPNYFGDGF